MHSISCYSTYAIVLGHDTPLPCPHCEHGKVLSFDDAKDPSRIAYGRDWMACEVCSGSGTYPCEGCDDAWDIDLQHEGVNWHRACLSEAEAEMGLHETEAA